MERWSLTLIGILSVLAILGNGGVIFLITTRRRLHKVANCFVLSLALSDFIFGALHLPLITLIEHRGRNGARLSLLVMRYLTAASITNLCVLSLDRYVAIAHPLRYVTTFMRPKRVCILISSAWVTALVRPMLFVSANLHTHFSLTLDIAFYHIIPCIALVASTARILLIVRRHSRQTASLEAQLRHNYPLESPRATKEAQSQALPAQNRDALSAKMLVVVAGVCVIYLVLMTTLPALRSFKGNGVENVREVALVFMILNSAVNPFAYARFKTYIKREMRVGLVC